MARAHSRSGVVAVLAVSLWTVVAAAFVILGSDLLWVVALGDVVRGTGSVPEGIPFAVAPQSGWHNPIVLAELLLSAVNGLGASALAAFQVVIVAATLAVLVAEGRRLGGSDAAVAAVVSLAVVGAAATFVVTRLPSLSLVPFVLSVALMRRQHERPDRRIWLLVPLYVVWGNLHGGVLVGLALLGVFLVASPGAGPVVRRIGVGLGCASALVLTSAGRSTPAYYVSALGNEAAARGSDLWARPDPTNPLDLATGLVVLVLLFRAARRRAAPWEWLVTLGLLVGTLSAVRHGVWLVLFLAPAAVRARPGATPDVRPGQGLRPVPVLVVALLTAGAAGGLLAARGDAVGPPGGQAVEAVREVAAGRPVLADEPLAETLAQAGVTVWAVNPIDAFPRRVQGEFLDFLDGARTPSSASDLAVAAVDVELAPRLLESGQWSQVRRVGGVVVLQRRS